MAADRKLGHYFIKETLGKGGFSKVKRGVDDETGENVALKLLKKGVASQQSMQQTRNEIEAMQRVEHPNVVRLKDVQWEVLYPKKNGKVVPMILVVLELCAGGELFEFLSYTGRFSEVIARTYFRQLIDGLDKCHSVGVTHRDLKPENLILDKDYVLKIADFGFARTDSAHQQTQCGTIGYMAPEMTENPSGYDPRKTDIWACGVILFIMLAGFPPFVAARVSDWWYKKLKQKRYDMFWKAHCRTVTFSDPIKDLLNKILCADPDHRISLEEIKKHQWFNSDVMGPAALTSALGRKKQEMTAAKEQEQREEMLAKNQDLKGTGNAQMFGSTAEDRDDGEVVYDEDDLPPTMEFVLHGMGHNKVMFAELGASGQDENDDEDDEDDQVEAQVYKPAAECYTRFCSELPASTLFARVLAMVRGLCSDYKINKTLLRIKVRVPTDTGHVGLTAQVFKDASGNFNHVQFKRIDGDGLQFRALFAKLREQMADTLMKV